MRYWISGIAFLLFAAAFIVLLIPGLFSAQLGWLLFWPVTICGVLAGLAMWSLSTARP